MRTTTRSFKKVEKIYEECSEIMNKGIMSGPDTGDDMFAIFLPLIHLVKHCNCIAVERLCHENKHVVVKARETLAEFYPGWVDMRLPKLYADTALKRSSGDLGEFRQTRRSGV